ncbi:hypothetical protein PsYK624_151200 [Phanerochaete sordida]|uniref:Uncharacterized protein n=1 Tax=Phanerochaete sordida TaxID=48140 RepID=A0A9P3GN74_9APHY|nr:hypothetical protein PsYK624_151200 [Phanerochaete sordida]
MLKHTLLALLLAATALAVPAAQPLARDADAAAVDCGKLAAQCLKAKPRFSSPPCIEYGVSARCPSAQGPRFSEISNCRTDVYRKSWAWCTICTAFVFSKYYVKNVQTVVEYQCLLKT